jgi:hypothetical protein
MVTITLSRFCRSNDKNYDTVENNDLVALCISPGHPKHLCVPNRNMKFDSVNERY